MATEQGINNDLLELKVLKAPIWLMTFKFKTWTLQNLAAVQEALDFLESQPGELGLITTGSHNRIYSAGGQLTELIKDHQYRATFLMHLSKLFARLMKLSFPTVAAINGHCYGGGAIVAMCHDFRVMRSDTAEICLSEINVGIPLSLGQFHMFLSKMENATIKKMAQFGSKYSAQQALAEHVVDLVVKQERLIQASLELLEPLVSKSKNREVFRQIKEGINHDSIRFSDTLFLVPLHMFDVLKKSHYTRNKQKV